MNILNSLPYIAGLLLQGEAGLIMWFLYFVNQPEMWEWICIIAVIISNISFMFYFFAGYYAEKFLNLHEKILKIAAKLGKRSLKIPQILIILFMCFLFLLETLSRFILE